ncbi:MAG: hypothetical protein QM632_00660 [Micrococcaceae bacterium]
MNNKNLLAKIGAWLNDPGGLTLRDLAVYRIFFSIIVLLAYTKYSTNAGIPNEMYHPIPGMLQLFHSFPPLWVLILFQVVYLVTASALLFGFLTPIASVLFGANMIIANGFTFALGKLDHGIIIAIVPMIMAFSGWGNAYSIDSKQFLSQRAHPSSVIRPWVIRWMALTISLWLFTAAFAKATTGWLDPSKRGTQGYFFSYYLGGLTSGKIPDLVSKIHFGPFWKFLDYSTVLCESLPLLLFVFGWKYWKLAPSFLIFFHIGINFTLSIFYAPAFVAYAAFVPWDRILRKVTSHFSALNKLRWPVVLIFALFWGFASGPIKRIVNPWQPDVLMLAGVILASGYIINFVRNQFFTPKEPTMPVKQLPKHLSRREFYS